MAQLTGLVLVDKPAGPSSFGVLRSLRPALGPKLGHAGHARPLRDGAPARPGGPGHPPGDVPLGARQALRGRRPVRRLLDDARPGGSARADRRRDGCGRGRRRGRRHDRRRDPGGAGRLGGQDRRPALVRPHAGRRGGRGAAAAGDGSTGSPSRDSTRRPSARRSPSSARRARTSARSPLTSARRPVRGRTASSSAGPAVGAFDVSAAGIAGRASRPTRRARGSWRRGAALPHLPVRDLSSVEADDARHGRGLEPHGETGPVRLVTGRGAARDRRAARRPPATRWWCSGDRPPEPARRRADPARGRDRQLRRRPYRPPEGHRIGGRGRARPAACARRS